MVEGDRERALAKSADLFGLAGEHVANLAPSHLTLLEWLEARAAVGRYLAEAQQQGNIVSADLGVPSAQDRLLAYFRFNLGRTVDKDQLSGVAGIHEWARRVRELRVEHGWPILSNETRDDLRPGEYRLDVDEPDEELAARWSIAKRIRNLRVGGRRASGKTRMLEYLKAIFPEAADKEQLAYVAAGMQERPRRLRELAEEGWPVVSSMDDPLLPPGAYRLGSLTQLPARTREAIKLRHEIFARDDFRCQDCGRSAVDDYVQIQAHHLTWVSQGGTNDPENLVTLCTDCHSGRHSLSGGTTKDELLNPEAETDY